MTGGAWGIVCIEWAGLVEWAGLEGGGATGTACMWWAGLVEGAGLARQLVIEWAWLVRCRRGL